jgi:hypothetical protein
MVAFVTAIVVAMSGWVYALEWVVAKAGTSVPEIAKHIDRSRGSIRDHALKLNITLAKGQRGPKVKR